MFAVLSLPLDGKILGISGIKYWKGSKHYTPPFQVIAENAEVIETDYPAVDVCNLPYEDESFDFVISDQVLEHVEGNPQRAVEECHRVLKEGGVLILGTVFIQPIHWGPKDMWRFSPDALRYLCHSFTEVVQCESWGNRWVHVLFFLFDKFRDWKVSERRFSFVKYLATLNDKNFPLTTWIIVKK